MDITIQPGPFGQAVRFLSRMASRGHSLPVLKNLLLTAENGRLVVTATDLSRSGRVRMPATVRADGRLCLPTQTLAALVDAAQSGDGVQILSDQNWHAQVLFGNAQYRLNGIDPEDFPKIDSETSEASATLSIGAQTLDEIVGRVLHAALRSNDSPYGVAMEIEKGKLRLVATDGQRLATGTVDFTPLQGESAFTVVVTPGTLGDLSALARQTRGQITLKMSPRRVEASIETHSNRCKDKGNEGQTPEDLGFEYGSRALDTTFPNWRQALPKEKTNARLFPTPEWNAVLSRAAILADPMHSGAYLGPGADGAHLSFTNEESGGLEEIIPLEKSEEVTRVMVNIEYLKDAVRALGSMALPGDQGLIEIRGAESPLLLHTGNPDEFMALVMPMRA